MIKNKIKRIFKKKVVLFICSFLSILAFIVLTNKFFGFRGDFYTWKELFSPIFIIGSLGVAAWITWVAFGDD